MQEVGKPFHPPGHKIHAYTLDRHDPSVNGTEEIGQEVEYEIRKGSFAAEDVRQYHQRIQVWSTVFLFSSLLSEGTFALHRAGVCDLVY